MRTLITIGKWLGGGLLGLLIVLGVAYFCVSANIEKRARTPYTFTAETLPIPHDSATLKQGEHLAIIKGCKECHGENLAGKMMLNDNALGRLAATNLTRGRGGLPADYSTADWLMALRHGVDRTGRPLLFMPAHETTVMTKADLQALLAYCQQVPSVDNELPARQIGPVSAVMTYLGKMPLLPVEMIDHQRPMVTTVDTAQGVALGQYLAVSCSGCHRPTFKGGDPVAPGFPPVPDLTRTGATGRWTQAQFMATLRTGKTPAGHTINNENMPWKMAAQYSDKELASLYQYFRSI